MHQCHSSGKAGRTPRVVPPCRMVGFLRGMLCSSEAENVPELMPWVGLWVLQAEIWGKMVRAGLCVCMSICVGKIRPYGLCHGVQPVPGDPIVSSPGDQSDHKLALRNIASMVRPGGVLVIDHRNYDHILAAGCASPARTSTTRSVAGRPCPIPIPFAPAPWPKGGQAGQAAGLCPGWGPLSPCRTQMSTCGLPERLDQGHHHLSAAGKQQGTHGDPGLHGAGAPH